MTTQCQIKATFYLSESYLAPNPVERTVVLPLVSNIGELDDALDAAQLQLESEPIGDGSEKPVWLLDSIDFGGDGSIPAYL